MSFIHQAEFVLLILSFIVGHLQSTEYLVDDWEPHMEDCPTKTHWNQVPYKTLRAFFWINVIAVSGFSALYLFVKVWEWLGGI